MAKKYPSRARLQSRGSTRSWQADPNPVASDKIIGSVELEVDNLICGLTVEDPRLYSAIDLLNDQVEIIARELSPLVIKSKSITPGISDLLSPEGFTCFSTGIVVRFTWQQVTYASQYEVRQGLVWETADFRFRTTGLQGNIDPLPYGKYTFLIKTVDAEGNYSAEAKSTIFEVPVISAPSITTSVIDNNVLLYWTEPQSVFKIDYYIVEKHGVGIVSGKVSGTFTSIFEVVAGTYEYCVTAVDIAGNVGEEAEVSVVVNTPPDYALQHTRMSDFTQTKYNVIRLPKRPSLVACWPPQTWQQHYRVKNNWMRPKEQMDAGYPIYIQPTVTDGYYVEGFDYGVIIQNVIVTITWNVINHVPVYNTDIKVSMMVGEEKDAGGNVIWSPLIEGASQYFRSFRYHAFKLNFTSENDKALVEVYNLTINLAVKRENDGGEVYASSSDIGGTLVNFTKPFKDIESITCTTKSTTEPFIVIFDFVDIPNPTHFSVYVFDTMGNRVSRVVDWKVRGIV